MVLLLTVILLVSGVFAEDALVNTLNGPIRGEKLPKMYVFKGIQYGESPVGEKRFEPVGVFRDKWTEVRNATEFANYCLQWREGVSGEEDCLFLNIYTSEVNEEENLPVFVHFHGGGFTYGSGTFFSPERMFHLQRLVFVTVNYRLGPLGFLSTEDEVLPGNMGLKDQVIALEWVKENIRVFGGNPESVTLSGFSAGGASVHLHYLSPLSTGLFHRGISHSGCALNPWVFAENSREKAHLMANHLGCDAQDTRKMIQCLKERPAEEIVGSVALFQPWGSFPFTAFGTVVEKQSRNPFLPAHPEDIYKSGKYSHLPWIVSYTNADGLFPAVHFLEDPTFLPQLRDNWDELAPFVLDFNGTALSSDLQHISSRIKTFYLADQEISLDTFDSLVQMTTDRHFAADISRCVRLHTQGSPTFLYLLQFPAVFGVGQIFLGPEARFNGAAHGDDVFMLLRNKNDPREDQSAGEKEICRLLTEIYTSFADESRPRLNGVAFEDVKSHGLLSFLNIRSPTNYSMDHTTSIGEEDFWASLPIRESGKSQKMPPKVEL